MLALCRWIALSNAAKNDSVLATQEAYQALLVELTNMEMQVWVLCWIAMP